MASTVHSYGPRCILEPESNLFTRRASAVSDDPPKIRAQFFYSSTLPIDDPLSPVPSPSSAAAAGPSKVPPRPFSVHDNYALEKAWLTLHKAESGDGELGAQTADVDLPPDNSDQHRIRTALTSLGGPAPTASTVDNLTKIIRSAHERRSIKLEQNSADKRAISRNCGSSAAVDGRSGTHTVVVEPTGRISQKTDPHLMLCDNPDHIPFDHAMPVASDEIENEEFESGLSKKRHRSPFRRHAKPRKSYADEGTVLSTNSASQNNQKGPETQFGGSPSERDTTGTPFLRVPERLKRPRSRDSRRKLVASQTDGAESPVEDGMGDKTRPSEQATIESQDDNVQYKESEKAEVPSILVPVGVSRLHMVEMPNLTVCEVK